MDRKDDDQKNPLLVEWAYNKDSLVSVAMAPMRTAGIAMTTHPTAATQDRICALAAVLAESTL